MTNDWTHNLKSLDLDDLDALDLDELDQPWEPNQYNTGIYGQALDLDAGIRTIIPIHHVVDATAVASMTTAIGRLPTSEEAIHLWIGGRHSMGHIIASVADLAAPAVIDELHVATLTFSKDNASEWGSMIDAGRIKTLTVCCSQYFQRTSTGIYQFAADLLERRGVKLFAVRSHCKILAAKLSDGRTITATGSANTRSAKTVEQVDLFGSREVYEFHVGQLKRAEGMAVNQMELPKQHEHEQETKA